MIPRSFLIWLIVLALVLPVVLAVLFGTQSLLALMQDATGAAVLGRASLTVGILWVVDLICLVVSSGIEAASRQSGGNDTFHDDRPLAP